MCKNDIAILNCFIKELENTPIKNYCVNENLYFDLKVVIENFLKENKNIKAEEIKSILKLYKYDTSYNKPDLAIILAIAAILFSVAFGEPPIPPFSYALIFIAIAFMFWDIKKIICFEAKVNKEYKIYQTILIILEEM